MSVVQNLLGEDDFERDADQLQAAVEAAERELADVLFGDSE